LGVILSIIVGKKVPALLPLFRIIPDKVRDWEKGR
jgi:hypothetical protein